MSISIQVEDAKLKTLTVTIQSLTVSGKQMTLAVFRQLPESDSCIDFDEVCFSDKVVMWGHVKYRIRHQDLWAVFSSNGLLFRYSPEKPERSDYKEDRVGYKSALVRYLTQQREIENLPQLFIAV